jgi:hypothetical protein
MLRELDIQREEERWTKEKDLIQRKQKIKEERKAIKAKKIPTTTKLLIFFLFLNCTLIELFTGWATIKSINLTLVTGLSPDFTPLVTLIGAVVGEVIGFAIYAIKSTKENTENGINYLKARHELEQQNRIENTDNSVG